MSERLLTDTLSKPKSRWGSVILWGEWEHMASFLVAEAAPFRGRGVDGESELAKPSKRLGRKNKQVLYSKDSAERPMLSRCRREVGDRLARIEGGRLGFREC